MFSKKLLKRLPLEKVAIVITAVALIALSMFLGGRTIESGNLGGAFDQLARTDSKGNLVADLGFISNVVISPSKEYVQGSRRDLTFRFTLARLSNKFHADILDARGQIVKANIFADSPLFPGVYNAVWNGIGDYRDAEISRYGDVPVGTYYIAFSDDIPANTAYFPFSVVNFAAGSNDYGSLMNSISTSPTSRSIDADANQAIHFYIGLNRPAYVTVSLYTNESVFVGTLSPSTYRGSVGQQEIFAWKGRSSGDQINDNGSFQRVAAGTYRVKIAAVDFVNPGITESTVIPVTVTRSGLVNGGSSNQFHVVSLSKYPDGLDLRNTNTSIRFSYTLNGVPSTMNATIIDTNGSRVVANLVPVGTCNNYVASQNAICTYYADWNGIDRNINAPAYAGNYKFRIEAANAMFGSENSEIAFQVYSNNIGYNNNGGYNPYDPNWQYNGYNSQARCGTIVDVSANDPLCPAIQFAMARKFIGGYPDGTVHLKDTIKRAEFLAVVASAFKYNLETYSPYTDGTLGFSDLYGKQDEWYMKYLKTFYRTGVMSGYPDRTMKPEKIMTTAELYVSLFKAAVMSPNRAARFPMIAPTAVAPFSDTPISPATDWYMYHAQFAKQFGLVTGTKFNPAKGITRGQVVKLIYDMHQKGLLAL